jgi:DNA-binding LacI/PurR family transcriptional regulator
MNRKIKAMLMERGIKISDVANRAGLAVPTVSGAINGHWASKTVREAVARELNLSMDKLNRLWKTRKAA